MTSVGELIVRSRFETRAIDTKDRPARLLLLRQCGHDTLTLRLLYAVAYNSCDTRSRLRFGPFGCSESEIDRASDKSKFYDVSPDFNLPVCVCC